MIRVTVTTPLDDNPLAAVERRSAERRRQKDRGGRILFVLLYVPALLAAAIPLFVQVTDATVWLLGVMIVIMLPVHVLVYVRTAATAVYAAAADLRSGHWDLLVLSGRDARQIVVAKWWALARGALADHAMLALIRLGLALAAAQLFHEMSIGGCYETLLLSVNCYFSYNSTYEFILYQPRMFYLFNAFVILLSFALAEAWLTTAAALVISLRRRFASVLGVGGFCIEQIVFRAALLATALSVNTVTEIHKTTYLLTTLTFECLGHTLPYDCLSFDISNFYYYYVGHSMSYVYYESANRNKNFAHLDYHVRHQLLKATQVTVRTPADGGLLLATDILRQYIEPELWLRNWLYTACGLLVYLLLIRYTLGAAVRAAIRRGALPPPPPPRRPPVWGIMRRILSRREREDTPP